MKIKSMMTCTACGKKMNYKKLDMHRVKEHQETMGKKK